MYTILTYGHIRNDLTGVHFAPVDGSIEYKEYVEWLSKGNTAQTEPDPLLSYVPSSVTARQARLALLEADLLDDVEILVQNQSRAVQLEWEYATYIERDNALLKLLNISEEQIDQLFIRANQM